MHHDQNHMTKSDDSEMNSFSNIGRQDWLFLSVHDRNVSPKNVIDMIIYTYID